MDVHYVDVKNKVIKIISPQKQDVKEKLLSIILTISCRNLNIDMIGVDSAALWPSGEFISSK